MSKKQKSILIMGTGITGKACIDYFKKHKYKVFVYDDKTSEGYKLINNLSEVIKEKIKLCITSPSINIKQNDFCKTLIGAGVKVVTELEYSLSKIKGKTIAVTGTNGKSTTCSLIYEMLSKSNKCFLAGNIGSPLISFIDNSSHKSISVIEVSSFMLENMNDFKFNVSCLLNLSEDHINWHGSLSNYFNAKLKIFNNQTKKQIAIINADDNNVCCKTKHLLSNVFSFSKSEMVKGCFVRNNKICYYEKNFEDIIDISEILLKGEKNIENVLCACIVAKTFNIKNEEIKNVLKTFKGLHHRIEFVREVGLVKYYNDSKATNISSTLCALKCFEKNVILLLGGQGKNQDFAQLFCEDLNMVKNFIIYGESKEDIFKCAKQDSLEKIFVVDKFDDAIASANKLANDGDIVLLSPACASFDEFRNFEHRGDYFNEIVQKF